jgi:hypothetical protein
VPPMFLLLVELLPAVGVLANPGRLSEQLLHPGTIVLKCVSTLMGKAEERPGYLADELLLNRQIPGLLQFAQVRGQIPRCHVSLILDKEEFRPLDDVEQSHNIVSRWLMNEPIDLGQLVTVSLVIS